MHLLWEDLERWANEDRHGDLGIFTARVTGGWVHVGMPLAQTLLTEHERAALPAVFSAARLDPTSFPPDVELARLLVACGTHYLRPRTLALLRRGAADADLVAMLLEIVKEELADWDGHTGSAAAAGNGREECFGNLRLCVALDRVAAVARFGVRCSMNRDFPEDGLTLWSPATGDEFTCSEEVLHWSTEIVASGAATLVDAARWAWDKRLELQDRRFGWRYTLRAGDVRIFASGATEGLPGFIEVHRLPAEGSFFLAVSPPARGAVEEWAAAACTGFRSVALSRGLPAGWSFFTAAGVVDNAAPCESYPVLSRPTDARFVLTGGIRASRRNWYLPFGLPDLVLESPRVADQVTCGTAALTSDGGLYRLSADIPAEERLVAEASVSGQVVRSKPFFVVGDFTWQWSTPLVTFDRYGAPRDLSLLVGEGAAGAVVPESVPSRTVYTPRPSCFERRRVFFLGRAPGQIASWPAEPLPTDWQPVWAVPLERKGRAIFCGIAVAGSEPLPAPAGASADRRKLKQWKEVLCHWQKRIDVPVSPPLAQLWKRFQEAARRA
jgi:hypothetical protein